MGERGRGGESPTPTPSPQSSRATRHPTEGLDVGQARMRGEVVVGGGGGGGGGRFSPHQALQRGEAPLLKSQPSHHSFLSTLAECLLWEKNRTEQNRTEQNRTEQNRTEQNRTEQNRTVQEIGRAHV